VVCRFPRISQDLYSGFLKANADDSSRPRGGHHLLRRDDHHRL